MTRLRHPGRQGDAHRDVQAELTDQGERKLTFGEDELQVVERIKQFMQLDVDELLTRELSDAEKELLKEAATFAESKPDTPNRRLAMAMFGLEEAARALYTVRADGRGVSDTQAIDTHTTGELRVSRTGSDFGTFMSFTYPVEGRLDGDGRALPAILHVVLPSDHYLYSTLQLGDPHEPVFYATEPDFVSPEWSDENEEWLEQAGGIARRSFSMDRSMLDSAGQFTPNPAQQRKDVHRRDAIGYHPLYRKDAQGIHRYVEITQQLLARFLDAAGKQEPVVRDAEAY